MENKTEEPRFNLKMTVQEREVLRQEAVRRGMLDEESNIIREGLRLYFEKYGTKLPENVFGNRKRGNRLPKSDRLTVISLQAVSSAA